ncbi:MAG: CRISPR-associated endonuclease Cas1 [Bacteroidales bacterium]|nr:CRISPR-associated endonuclease Cas1 [Bacteroidales bacterium]
MHLVLNTFGTYLAVQNRNFIVIHSDGRQTLEPSKIKTISISKGAQISSDAAIMAIENNIDVIFTNNVGKPIGRIWSNKFGSITTIRRKQLDFTLSKQAIDWIKEIIAEKISNQIALLLTFDIQDNTTQNNLNRITNRILDYKNKVSQLEGENIADVAKSLRGWEGAASKNYFSALNFLLPEQYRFDERSQHPAKDIFNALLNYGYGMMYGKIEAELIRAGIDPYVGVMHREDYNRPVLTFDVIEKYRVWVDFVVINLLLHSAIDEDSYLKKEDGSVWLEGLSKRILIQSINDFLEEIVKIGSFQRSRNEHIKIFCQKLAKKFMFFNEIDN